MRNGMLNYYFNLKLYKSKRLDAPEIRMFCVIPYNLHEADAVNRLAYIHIERQVRDWLREFDGIYFDGATIDNGYVSADGCHYLEYHFKVMTDIEIAELIVKHFKQLKINTTQRLEAIMAKTATKSSAPYKLWSIQTLKEECKRRKFKKADYAELDNKKALIALLEADDAGTAKKTPAKKTASKTTSKKTKPEPEEEEEELEEEEEDEEDGDEEEETTTDDEEVSDTASPTDESKIIEKAIEEAESRIAELETSNEKLKSVLESVAESVNDLYATNETFEEDLGSY